MLLLLAILAIWLFVGAGFGWVRARARYHQTLEMYPALIRTEPSSIKREAVTDAVLEFIKWTLLGFISGISYIAWILLAILVRNEETIKKSNAFFGAVIFSILVFVLGVLSLEKRHD